MRIIIQMVVKCVGELEPALLSILLLVMCLVLIGVIAANMTKTIYGLVAWAMLVVFIDILQSKSSR